MKTIKKIAEGSENTLKAFFSANIVLSFFMAGMLQYLWGMINTLQVIVLTGLFGLTDVPPNAAMVM